MENNITDINSKYTLFENWFDFGDEYFKKVRASSAV